MLEICRIKRELRNVQPASPLSTDMYRPVEIPSWCPEEFHRDPPGVPVRVPSEIQLGNLQNVLQADPLLRLGCSSCR